MTKVVHLMRMYKQNTQDFSFQIEEIMILHQYHLSFTSLQSWEDVAAAPFLAFN